MSSRSGSRTRRLVCATLLASGCGSLVDATWLGDPLLSLNGTVYAEGLQSLDGADLRVAMFWDLEGAQAEQVVVASTSFPARYRLDLFEPPPEGALVTIGQGSDQEIRVAMGRPMLFADLDGSGDWTDGLDPIVGGSADMVVLWADTAEDLVFDPDLVWLANNVQQGFQRMYAFRESCDGSSIDWLEPAGDASTDLLLGNIWSYQWELECDEDWGNPEANPEEPGFEECPPAWNMVHICQEQDAYVDDESMQVCIDQYCYIADNIMERWDQIERCQNFNIYEVCLTDDADWEEWYQDEEGFWVCTESLCPYVQMWDMSPVECPHIEELFEICADEAQHGQWTDDPYMSMCMEYFCW